MPPRLWSSADLDAVIARVTPDVLVLLGDGMPRSRGTILTALADRRTVMRLVVLGQLAMQGSRYTLPAAEAEQG
jgi:hypothetical protein